MPNQKPKVYKGDLGYVFVSYAHEDSKDVLPIVHALVAEGCCVWYDDGIELATDYPSYIADHVHECAVFMMFISNNYNASKWCHVEASYALHLNKAVLPVYLEDVELERGLQMRLIAVHSITYAKFSSKDELCRELLKAEVLRTCLSSEDEVGEVARRATFAEYSWAELKSLSRAIAAAGSNAEGLGIAKAYGLVDKDGKLRGDTKGLVLTDGTASKARILGFRHDGLAGGGRAGISFEFADIPMVHRINADWTNEGGWVKSEMRTWLNGEFLAKLPEDLRQLLDATVKMTNNEGLARSENDISAVTKTEDRLWLLSMSEVYGNLVHQSSNVPRYQKVYDAEGSQYQLYTDKHVSTTNYGFCKKRGADSWWWLRSPLAYGPDRFRCIGFDGDWYGGNTDRSGGVSPGFCF